MTILDRLGGVPEGTAVKRPARVATTGPIVLNGLQSIDGLPLAEGDRVLVRAQSDARENGIYTVSAGNWIRTADAARNGDLFEGSRVFVNHGTVYAGRDFSLTTDDAIVVGTTALAFSIIRPAGSEYSVDEFVGATFTDRLQDAFDSGEKALTMPPGALTLEDTSGPTVDGQRLVGRGQFSTIITSTAAGHSILVPSGLTGVEFHDFTLKRLGVTPEGRDGIHFAGYTQLARVERVSVYRHWHNFRFGETSLSYCIGCFSQNAYGDGFRITNEDGASVGVIQWELVRPYADLSNGYGIHVRSTTTIGGGGATCGPIVDSWTWANSLGGIAYRGTSGHGINGVRLHGGFSGSEGWAGVLLDTYGTFDQHIVGHGTEANGLSATGVDLGTPATNLGRGILLTENNVQVVVSGVVSATNANAGIETAADRVIVTGSSFRGNGTVGVDDFGIMVTAGEATIVGNSSKAQAYGIHLGNDSGHLVANNQLQENDTAPIGSSVTLKASRIVGNLPRSSVSVDAPFTSAAPDGSYAISYYEDVLVTTGALTAPRTWTLPAAGDTPPGKRIRVVDMAGGVSNTNTLTIARAGSDTINGGTTRVLNAAYASVELISDGVDKWGVL